MVRSKDPPKRRTVKATTQDENFDVLNLIDKLCNVQINGLPPADFLCPQLDAELGALYTNELTNLLEWKTNFKNIFVKHHCIGITPGTPKVGRSAGPLTEIQDIIVHLQKLSGDDRRLEFPTDSDNDNDLEMEDITDEITQPNTPPRFKSKIGDEDSHGQHAVSPKQNSTADVVTGEASHDMNRSLTRAVPKIEPMETPKQNDDSEKTPISSELEQMDQFDHQDEQEELAKSFAQMSCNEDEEVFDDAGVESVLDRVRISQSDRTVPKPAQIHAYQRPIEMQRLDGSSSDEEDEERIRAKERELRKQKKIGKNLYIPRVVSPTRSDPATTLRSKTTTTPRLSSTPSKCVEAKIPRHDSEKKTKGIKIGNEVHDDYVLADKAKRVKERASRTPTRKQPERAVSRTPSRFNPQFASTPIENEKERKKTQKTRAHSPKSRKLNSAKDEIRKEAELKRLATEAQMKKQEMIQSKADRVRREREERELKVKINQERMEKEKREKLLKHKEKERQIKEYQQSQAKSPSRSKMLRNAQGQSPARMRVKSPGRMACEKTPVKSRLELFNNPSTHVSSPITPLPVKKALISNGQSTFNHTTHHTQKHAATPKRKSRVQQTHIKMVVSTDILNMPDSEFVTHPMDMENHEDAEEEVVHTTPKQEVLSQQEREVYSPFARNALNESNAMELENRSPVKKSPIRQFPMKEIKEERLSITDEEEAPPFVPVSIPAPVLATTPKPKAPQQQTMIRQVLDPIQNQNIRPDSYPMSPHASEKVVFPKSKDDYGIEDLGSEDETDDEDAPKKPVPEWARSSSIRHTVRSQYCMNFDRRAYFGLIAEVNLDMIFGAKKKYKARTSSACWNSPISNPRAGDSSFLRH